MGAQLAFPSIDLPEFYPEMSTLDFIMSELFIISLSPSCAMLSEMGLSISFQLCLSDNCDGEWVTHRMARAMCG